MTEVKFCSMMLSTGKKKQWLLSSTVYIKQPTDKGSHTKNQETWYNVFVIHEMSILLSLPYTPPTSQETAKLQKNSGGGSSLLPAV